jgi:hypothetical protein
MYVVGRIGLTPALFCTYSKQSQTKRHKDEFSCQVAWKSAITVGGFCFLASTVVESEKPGTTMFQFLAVEWGQCGGGSVIELTFGNERK